jgi:hypothetical protein
LTDSVEPQRFVSVSTAVQQPSCTLTSKQSTDVGATDRTTCPIGAPYARGVRRRGRGVRGLAGTAVSVLLVLGGACGDEDSGDDGEDAGSEGGEDVGADLRQELLEMQEADQAERTGQSVEEWNDQERTDRLGEIVEEHGWPTIELVGEDGASAAWLIAQHSDLDPRFQEEALEHMRAAVEDEQADPTELAYLEDRVALNGGRPQTYGTQIGCVDGRAEPAELADAETVEERRAEVGLQPLEDYLAELRPDCEAEAAAQAEGGEVPPGG